MSKNLDEETIEEDVKKENLEEDVKEENLEEDVKEENLKEIEFEEDSVEDELSDKVKELEDKNVRLLAEYQNYKRRSLEDNQKATDIGKKEVISELLETIDNLERALAMVDGDKEVSTFVEGVQMVQSSLLKKLKKLGLIEVDCSGIADPNIHHAVMTDCVDDMENDQIIEVLQKGYQLNEIIIRPAMVKVNQK